MGETVKSKKVTVTKAYIDQLKSERDSARKERDELKEDLTKHRNYWTWLFRQVTTLHGKNQALHTGWTLESLAKHFGNVKSWYWG